MAPQHHPPTDPTPANRALTTTRLIWAAMLIGQVMFLFVIVFLWSSNAAFGPSPDMAWLLFQAAVVTLIVAVPVGYVCRQQVYKRNWVGDAIKPQGYLTGNVVLLALCEGVSMLGLVATLLNGSLWPTLAPSVIAMAVQVINFPNGRAMQPAPATFGGYTSPD